MNMRITFMLRIIVLAFSFYLCGFVIIICFFCQLDSLIGKEKREFQTISSPYNACWHYLFAQNSLAEISVLHKINHIKIEYCICEFVSNLSRIVHIWFRFKKKSNSNIKNFKGFWAYKYCYFTVIFTELLNSECTINLTFICLYLLH